MRRPEVTREQALAHRATVQALHRPTADATELALWDVGVQDSPAGSAALALAARVQGGLAATPDLTDARRFTTIWAIRGAPAVLRSGDVGSFAAALWPIDAADAVGRLAGNGQALRKGGHDPVEAIRVTAEALRAVVTEAMTKGEASTEVSARIPEEYITWCRPCQAHHLGDQLMRVAALAAGVRLVPGASPTTLEPIARWAGVPRGQDGTDGLVRAYLHLCGPATPGDVATFLQTSVRAVKAVWPDHLVEVSLAGRRAWSLEEDVDDLLASEPSNGTVRLLPRSDPWLLARDRELTVPGAAHRKVLWPALAWPGAVWADGEVVAAWRTRAKGTSVAMTVEPFTKLSVAQKRAIEDESADVAASRQLDEVRVSYLDAA